MKKRIAAKSVNGKVIDGFYGDFSWDKFSPNTVTVDFRGNVWMFEREMLLNGGDFGGDIAIVVDEYETVIGLTKISTGKVSPIVFDTLSIRGFLNEASSGIDIPKMRECEVDNFIVQFYDWNAGLV